MSIPHDHKTVYLIDEDHEFSNEISDRLHTSGFAVRRYGSAELFILEISAIRTGCVVSPLRLPGLSAIDLIRAVAAEIKALPAIVIGAGADGALAFDAIRAGAVDFIARPFDPDALVGAVSRAMDGFCTAAHLRAEAVRALKRLAALSRREHEVLDRFAEGLAIKEIANNLGLSPKSVETYRARLIEKLEAKSPARLMRLALLASVIEPLP